MSTIQRPPEAAVAKWRQVLRTFLWMAVPFLFGWCVLSPLVTQPRVTRFYEDGSGELSDGRSFCIAGELCDREVAP